MPTSQTQDNEKIVEINGLTIRKNSLYKVVHKLDKSAPDGFQREGATKLPSEGIGNTIPCRFIIQDPNSKRGVYDTGFSVNSPCYSGMDESKRKEIVNRLKKYIVEPYERSYKGENGEALLDATNTSFWDSFGVTLWEGRIFNTEKVEDLLDLYIAMQSFELCPVNEGGSPKFNQADYMIEDNITSVTVGKKRTNNEFTAISKFMNLLSVNKTKLFTILRSIGIITPNIAPEDTDLIDIFNLWLRRDIQNPDYFLKNFDKAETEDGELELTLQVNIKKLVSSKKITKVGSQLTYKGYELGGDIKTAATNVMKNPELDDIKDELILTK